MTFIAVTHRTRPLAKAGLVDRHPPTANSNGAIRAAAATISHSKLFPLPSLSTPAHVDVLEPRRRAQSSVAADAPRPISSHKTSGSASKLYRFALRHPQTCPCGNAISKAVTNQQSARSVIVSSATAIYALNTCSKSSTAVLAGRYVSAVQDTAATNPVNVQDADVYDPAARQAEEREMAQLIKKIDTAALEARATRLRQGLPCAIAPLCYDRTTRSSVMGGMNYHVNSDSKMESFGLLVSEGRMLLHLLR